MPTCVKQQLQESYCITAQGDAERLQRCRIIRISHLSSFLSISVPAVYHPSEKGCPLPLSLFPSFPFSLEKCLLRKGSLEPTDSTPQVSGTTPPQGLPHPHLNFLLSWQRWWSHISSQLWDENDYFSLFQSIQCIVSGWWPTAVKWPTRPSNSVWTWSHWIQLQLNTLNSPQCPHYLAATDKGHSVWAATFRSTTHLEAHRV